MTQIPAQTEEAAANDRALFLYDGLCGLCNSAVRWVIQRDHADKFRFAPQQSPLANSILAQYGIDREAMLRENSVYLLLHPNSPSQQLLSRSDATVNMLILLGGRWAILGKLFRAVPPFLRNAAYGLFARNRYRLTTQYQTCPLPTPAERAKFLA